MTESWAATSFDEGAAVNQKPSLFSDKAALAKRVYDSGQPVRRFYRKQIDEHIATLDPNNPRDFVDAYLLDRGVENVDYQVMEGTVMILSPDATDTLGVALSWVMFNMAYYPEVQCRLQKELDDVIGQGRQPNLGDRHALPYAEAIIMETQRMNPTFAVSFPHSNPHDVKLSGYRVHIICRPILSCTFARF